MKYIKTPVVFVYRCETCGCDELDDANGKTIALVQGSDDISLVDESDDVALRGHEMAKVLNAHDALVIACERSKEYLDRVLIQTGDSVVMELVECLHDVLVLANEDWATKGIVK